MEWNVNDLIDSRAYIYKQIVYIHSFRANKTCLKKSIIIYYE